MVATVKCYYNTGLTPSNCLDGSNLLDELGFTYKDFPDIAIKQDRGIIKIRLNTTYEDIKDADYCKINTNCYWITNIVMLNDNVAEIELQQDCLTTVGVYPLFKINILSGWCTRRHVLDDAIYNNIIDEPFTPTNEPVIETGTVIAGSSDTGFYSIILSTVDLLNIKDTAKAYLDDAKDKVLVPELPIVEGTVTTYTSHIVEPSKTAYIALSNAFNGDNNEVKIGMTAVRGLGVESCIGAAYMLPKAWATITESNGLITGITDKSAIIDSSLSPIWGTYKNNKVYSGQFQKIVVFSLASGDSCENRVEDILTDTKTSISWVAYADTRYSGKPGCKPLYFKGHKNTAAMQSIYGANWQQTPFLYHMDTGNIFTAVNTDIAKGRNFTNFGNAIAGSILNGVSNWASAALNPMSLFGNSTIPITNLAEYSGVLGTTASGATGLAGNLLNIASSIGNWQFNRQQILLDANKTLLSPDIKFPQVPQMADYVGNAFYDLRYKLSDNDMERFDNFLTAYGYAVDEPLKVECFSGRENFNFVKANDVSLKVNNYPQYLLDGMAKQIEAGVRIWHKAPSSSALTNNPIV